MSVYIQLGDIIDNNKSMDEVLPVAKEIFNLIISENKWSDDFYLHPLGFFYCRLFDNNENQIRLHIWERNYPVKNDLYIHDHYYDLCSWILCGGILDFSYSAEKTSEVTQYAKFTSSYLNGNDVRTLNRTDEFIKLNRTSERTLVRGEKYLIPKGTFHSNVVSFDDCELTVTLVYTFNNNQNHSPNVIGSAKNDSYYENNPQKISAEKVKALIENAYRYAF